MALAQRQAQKAKLNQTLRNWLPLLQVASDELRERVSELLDKNPFASVEQKKPDDFNSAGDYSDSCIYYPSLYESLLAQINAPLFKSSEQIIANAIIECISDEGYFEFYENALKDFKADEIEKIRLKFKHLEPTGVGAKDYKESFLWQLDELCDGCFDDAYKLAKKIIENFENLSEFRDENDYEAALNLIKKLKNPPAIDFMSDEPSVIPDLVVLTTGGEISIKLNDDFYPEIKIDADGLDEKMDFVSAYIRQAKDLIDALNLRKATLYKIGLMIIEYQYDYFFGGQIKPMKLKDIAQDLGRSPSTISRAIANKYLLGPKGIEPLKNFFATEIGSEEVSNAALKDFVRELVKNENHEKPLSDEAILQAIKAKFGTELVRRTITKYRKILNIASSSERKKFYALKA